MKITIYGEVINGEKYNENLYLYTVKNDTSSIYLLSELSIANGSAIKVEGYLDNFMYKSLIALCVRAEQIRMLRYINNISVLIPMTCTLDSLNKISNNRYIAKYKIIKESNNNYDVLYITSIISTKHIIDELIKVKPQGTCSVTVKPIIDSSSHSKRRYDMMSKTIGVKAIE